MCPYARGNLENHWTNFCAILTIAKSISRVRFRYATLAKILQYESLRYGTKNINERKFTDIRIIIVSFIIAATVYVTKLRVMSSPFVLRRVRIIATLLCDDRCCFMDHGTSTELMKIQKTVFEYC